MGSFSETYNDPVGKHYNTFERKTFRVKHKIFQQWYINEEKQKMNLPFRIQPW